MAPAATLGLLAHVAPAATLGLLARAAPVATLGLLARAAPVATLGLLAHAAPAATLGLVAHAVQEEEPSFQGTFSNTNGNQKGHGSQDEAAIAHCGIRRCDACNMCGSAPSACI
jgi:hypothetical protein